MREVRRFYLKENSNQSLEGEKKVGAENQNLG